VLGCLAPPNGCAAVARCNGDDKLSAVPGEDSVVDIVASDAIDIAADLGEITLDRFLDDGFLKDIPFVGTAVKLYRAGVGIGAFLFTQKLLRFLGQLAEVPKAEREAFARRLDQDRDQKRKVGEHLLLLLERQDEMRKPALLARAFQAYIRGEIDFAQFQALGAVIDRCFFDDLTQLAPPGNRARYQGGAALRLQSCGLVEVRVVPSVPHPQAPNEYETTDLGDLFRRIVLRI
jgi:hypothetical protein